MRRFISFMSIGLFLLASSACVSNKKIIYLQNLEGSDPIFDDELVTYEIPDYKLQYNDIIDVNIQTVEQLIENGFNGQGTAGAAGMQVGAQSGGDVLYMTGYTVDKNGNIRLPIVGDVSVGNKTIDEARIQIETELKKYVTSDVYVKVKLGGIRYSALGEFNSPGKFVVLQDRMTIFEAVANAGDLNTIAKRDEILLIRQYPEGTKLHRLNLKDRNIISSQFYFIQPNDQLYAEPMKVREVGAAESATQNIFLFTSVITTVLLMVNLLNNN